MLPDSDAGILADLIIAVLEFSSIISMVISVLITSPSGVTISTTSEGSSTWNPIISLNLPQIVFALYASTLFSGTCNVIYSG